LTVTRTHRHAWGIAGLGIASALALSACGTNNNTATASSSSPATTGSSAGGSSASGSGTSGITCASGSLNASGSTAQSNAMSAWIKQYQSTCSGANINYPGGGSGKGVTDFSNGTTDFAGSDFPLSSANRPAADKRCGGTGNAIDLPMTPGPIAVGYNLPGVSNLNLSGKNLAQIFSGKITKWNDPAITADNSGANLPPTAIATFHRSDGSGTSFNFTNYLKNVGGSEWSYGVNKTWPAPGGQGSNGTQGIAQGVKSTVGGVGYMEESFASKNKISVAKVGNAAGKFVELTNDNTVNFLSHAKVVGTGNDLTLKFDYTFAADNAYPNLLVTYEITCASGNKNAALLKGFLGYLASSAGQDLLPTSGYIKLPGNIDTKVATTASNLS